ncbi:MAG TPA: hypothetical protein ENI77_11685 [Nitrospirae bacterium]|nr:hypothetical protein [Nitrospirota bacterium]
MEKIKADKWKVLFFASVFWAVTAGPSLAQSGLPLGSLFVGGGYDDDIRPGEKGAKAEKENEPAQAKPEEAAKNDPLAQKELVMGRDLTRDSLNDQFFNDPSKQEPLTYPQMYETAGYMSKSLDYDGELIDGEPSGQGSFSMEDTVYINIGEADGASNGAQYIVYNAARPNIKHPITGADMGFKVLINGVIELTEVNMDISKARVIRSYNAIERGDKVRLYTKADIPSLDPDRPVADKDIDGYLVASKDPKKGYATGDVVFFDVGGSTGVEPGDVFDIIDSRNVIRKDGKKVKGIPKLIGKAKIISIQDSSSVAFITRSVDAIYAGDEVSYSRTR